MSISTYIKRNQIQIAYESLIEYLLSMESLFEEEYKGKYSCGSIGRGYLDIT